MRTRIRSPVGVKRFYSLPGSGEICHMLLKGRQLRNRFRRTVIQLAPMKKKPKYMRLR